ncbi:electron transport complex subunit RsxC [Halomonas sp. 328]|uniref:electron transport complex subunit RsxC n=1 Tax=Halomonas sp. 328 TaxID=2776704 RepID=UPI0018A6EC74|nr:electron transport complex subunit RsxC [Halomonas sp. 328]MBF8224266.1 electron transport complex subunit RsxC [Halomonas sp. 328]
MSRAFDFPGGIHPPTRKARSTREPLREAPLPRRVVLPLAQHRGQPAVPCVAVGERVRTGQVIARPQGRVSAALHASISGTVSAIEPRPVPHPGDLTAPCIVIEGDGADDWAPMPALAWRDTPTEALHRRLAESGLVGLGGAGFPSQIKARLGEHHPIDTLVVNAAECEPYISADDLTLRHHAAEVLEGARLLAHLLGAERILVGIEDDKPEALAALNTAIAAAEGMPAIELKVIETRYPSGGEAQLIRRLLGRQVPGGGLPADVGVVCHNPGTLWAALEAVRDGRPLVSRVVTLTGEALARPGNVIARLGTPLAELLEDAGLDPDRLARLVMGGPLMGQPLARLDLPLVKSTNCLIAASAEELPAPPPPRPCIRCGDCETACPVALAPQRLFAFAQAKSDDKARELALFDCIECGACDYVCPSHLPLVSQFRAAKDRLRRQEAEARRAEHARHRYEGRQARLEREAAEKEARRQARRQAASRPPSGPAPQARAQDSGGGQDAVKSLRIAQAAAKAALRKAERALARASDADEATLADLETQRTTAEEHLKAAEARLQTAQTRNDAQSSAEESP